MRVLTALVATALYGSLLVAAAGAVQSPPNILFILVDDLGRAELGYQRAVATREVQTPHVDELVSTGVKLDRHYVHKFCSPTRCAIQSGRAPIHVNVINASPDCVNGSDPVGGYAGIARNMTGIAEVLKRANYSTHMVGKWDAGMATPQHTPAGRGYDTTLIYFHHANDYYTFESGECSAGGDSGEPSQRAVKDMWNMEPNGPAENFPGKPATAKKNSPSCTVKHQHPKDGPCVYEDDIFEQRVHNIIKRHDKQTPLFIFWATHIVHGPLQVPDSQLARFNFINITSRQTYHAMVNYIDAAIGRVVDQLKSTGLYDNTLIVFSADNGGPLPAGNNYPLKGGKFSNWEGGIRVNAFVSGGYLPHAVRGTTQAGLVAGWDWYATFAGLAGVDSTDHRAAAAGLPPVDSVDVWPLISGQTATSPRSQVEIGSNIGGDSSRRSGATAVGGLIVPPHKIVLGYGPNSSLSQSYWPGPVSPNGTAPPTDQLQSCGRTPQTGCLFDVYADPGEHHNLAASMPGLYKSLLAKVEEVEKTVYSPSRGASDPRACDMALNNYSGFWGPFVDV